MNDNSINSFLNSGVGSEKAYYDILNRRTPMDDVGDAFTQQSLQPTLNAKQKAANALMAGMGAGFKASQSAVRNNRLEEVEAKLKQVVDQRMNLQTQLGQRQLTQATFANFAVNNYGDLKKWNDARGAEDQIGENEIGMALYNRFASENPELTAGMGKIDHILNGKAYFDKDGRIGGMSIKDLIEPLVSQLPEEQQRELSNLTSSTMRNHFAKSDLLEKLSLNDKRAQINMHNAQANQANAHAELYRNEANKVEIPSKYDVKTAQHIAKTNIDWVNKSQEDAVISERSAQAYDKIAQLIKMEQQKGLVGRSGPGIRATLQRYINMAGNESTRNQALIELEKSPLFPALKDTFSGATSDRDIELFLTTLPSLEKDAFASIEVAAKRAAQIRTRNRENQIRARILETQFKYGEPYNSQAVNDRVRLELMDDNSDLAKEIK